MYSTVDEIREVFEENDIGNEAVITDAEIIRIITDVDAEIDAALYRRYITPFADRPLLIQKISKFKSTAQAMRDIQRSSNSALIKPEVMEYYETRGKTMIEDLRTGRLEMAGSRRLQMAATTH
ncbi:hypothetical protein METP3_03400 [Methanosarcinales archaeon]|nr:hypothetical protein METP3_03400 [Methanosarcinales archaeon]